MNIQQNYNQPAFRGYVFKTPNMQSFKKGWVDNSLENRIENIVKTECKNIVKQANKQHLPVNKELIEQYKEQGKRVLDKWNKFMQPLNKDTGLYLVDWLPRDWMDRKYTQSYLDIRNPIMKGGYKIVARPHTYKEKVLFSSTRSSSGFPYSVPTLLINNKNGLGLTAPYAHQNIKTLESLEEVADSLLTNIKPKDIDSAIFESAKRQFINSVKSKDKFNFIERFMLRKRAKKIDKYAEKQGLETFATEYIERIFNTIKNNNKMI